MKILGIDDAGRGPILGPMVLAGVLIEDTDEPNLKKWGVKDSKKLTPIKRREMEKKLKKKFNFHIEMAFPEEIDSRTKLGTNLNRIEAVKAAAIINNLLKDLNEEIRIIIDCPSPNREAWKNYLMKH